MKHIITYDVYRKVRGDDFDWVGRTEEVSHERLSKRIQEIDTHVCHRYLQVDGKFVFSGVFSGDKL